MALPVPKYFTSMAGKRMLAGARGMAQPGAAIGAAAGGLHGALTNDPNNPNEGRIGRILSGALGGAALGAGAGGIAGGAKAHVGNLTRAAKNQGRMQGFLGGMAVGAGGAANAGTVKNVAKGVMDRAAAGADTIKNVTDGVMGRAATQSSAARRAAKVQGQQVVHAGGPSIAVPPSSEARRAAKVQGQQAVHAGGAPIQAGPSGAAQARDAVAQRRAAKVQSQQSAHAGGAPIAAPGQVKKPAFKEDPYYNPSSEFYGGPEATQSSPGIMQRAVQGVKNKVQDIRQSRAASRAVEQDARDFVDKGQWKVSSSGFWAGFLNRSNGAI